MKLCILISCMHQQDYDIIRRSNVQTDAVVVNQCGKDEVVRFTITNKKGRECKIVFVSTTERGLSRSRNMAIRYAEDADICLICDDDEWLDDNYEETITSAYIEDTNADLIAFSLIRNDVNKQYPQEKKSLGFKQIFKTSSLQITFKRRIVQMHNIIFDEKMGSGTGNGGGEENKFLLDCRRKKLGMFYVPSIIATVNPGKSQWFFGYTKEFFETRGWSSRRSLGLVVGFVYCCYFAIKLRGRYKDSCTFLEALLYMYRGFKSER